MKRPLTEAEAKTERNREAILARRCQRDFDDEVVNLMVDRVELEALTVAQSRVIYSLRRQLRRLRDAHRAADFVRLAASELGMDSVTLSYAFYDWIGSLSQAQLDRLRATSEAQKREWAGPL